MINEKRLKANNSFCHKALFIIKGVFLADTDKWQAPQKTMALNDKRNGYI